MARSKKHKHIHVHYPARHGQRKYGLGNFVVDVLMTCITAGLWLIWVFVREMRNR